MYLEKNRKDYKQKGCKSFNKYLEEFYSSYPSIILDLDRYTKIFPPEFYNALGKEDIRNYVSATSLDCRKNKNGVLCLTLEIFPSQPSKINFCPFCLICYPTNEIRENNKMRRSCINAFIPVVRNTLTKDKKIYFDPENNIELLMDILLEKQLLYLLNEIMNSPDSDLLLDTDGNMKAKDILYIIKFLYRIKHNSELNMEPELVRYDYDYIIEKSINLIL